MLLYLCKIKEVRVENSAEVVTCRFQVFLCAEQQIAVFVTECEEVCTYKIYKTECVVTEVTFSSNFVTSKTRIV